MRIKKLIWICLSASIFGTAHAQVSMPNIFTSNMVLQQEKKVAVWGKATPGEKITVRFASQEESCITKSDSTWTIWLKPMKSSFEGREMTVKGKNNEIKFENILVGEVWLCGGQSNMEYPMNRKLKRYAAPKRGKDLAQEECNNVSNKYIRLFLVEKKYGLPDCQTRGWQEAVPSSTAPFSAAAYYFGKTLQENLQVPVGIISSSWGGSRIENWMPEDVYKNSSFYAKERNSHPKIKRSIALYYNTMIKPLAPYTLRGFTWYQGESDAIAHDSLYVEKFSTLLQCWRKIFRNKNLPMYYVQIAPYYYSKRLKDTYRHDEWLKAEFAELQTQCMKLPHTGQIIVTDLVDNLKDIHPSYKWEVGNRLALWALSKDYKKKEIVYSGPQIRKARIKGNKIIVEFKSTGSGLTTGKRNTKDNSFIPTSEKANWFEIAEKDGIFHSAEAEISDNKILIEIPQGMKPDIIRFGWNEKAMPNLFNQEGLPAAPFIIKL